HPATIPYVLRSESHILTTEGGAMMFERMSKKRAFIEKMGLKVAKPEAFDDAASKSLRYQLLIFSRWCQVMLRFEKSMYEDPEQDLNKLWWDMVEKYQFLRRPPGRNAPAVYKGAPANGVVYAGNKDVGQFMQQKVFEPGRTLSWNELTRFATGS